MKLDSYLLPLTKTNLKWIKDLNIRPETIKLMKKTQGKSSLTLVLAMIFLDLTPKTQATKAKINKWDYIKLKSFSTVKETINKMKRQLTEWEKIFVNQIPDELISEVYKELIQLNSKNKRTKKQPTNILI